MSDWMNLYRWHWALLQEVLSSFLYLQNVLFDEAKKEFIFSNFVSFISSDQPEQRAIKSHL